MQNRAGPGDYDPLANSVKIMTMKVSKGLEFPVVAIPGVERLEHMGAEATEPGEGAQALSEAEAQARREAARVLYVAATQGDAEVGAGSGWREVDGRPGSLTSVAPSMTSAPGAAPAPSDKLHAELRTLVTSSRQRLAGAVNAELTRLY